MMTANILPPLHIQIFIRNHPDDWESLLSSAPYYLKIKRSSFSNGEYVMFNYDTFKSDKHDAIVSEARGLILDSQNNWKIVRKGFNRFFNYKEEPAAKIDWSTADATIKEDGTLIFLSYYDNHWIWGTRQNFDVDEAPMQDALYSTFGALLRDVLNKKYPKFNIDKLVPGLTYCFELCTRYNRIVIDYPEPKLFFLAVFNAEGVELLPDPWVEYLGGIKRPTYYKMSSPEDYAALIEGFGIKHEGIVVKDGLDQRIKMKSKLYFELHKTANNGNITEEAIVNMIRSGEDAEFLSYFPEYKEHFNDIRIKWNDFTNKIVEIRNYAKNAIEQSVSRKDYAMSVKDKKLSDLYFKAIDNKLTDDFIANISNEKIVKMLK